MQKKALSHLLIALSVLGNIFCAYVQSPMRLTRRIKEKNKIQKEDTGQVQSGWTKLQEISYEPYGEIPYSGHHIHEDLDPEPYYNQHDSYQPQMLQAVSNLNEEVNRFTNEFLGVMGPLLFPLPFFLAMLPFALPAIPLAIYLDTIGDQHHNDNNNHHTSPNPNNNTNHNNPHSNHTNNPNNHNDPSNSHNNPNNNHNNPNNNPNSNNNNNNHNNNNNNNNNSNNNNPNGNNSGQMMGGLQTGTGGNGSLELPPFPMTSPSSMMPFPGPENPDFPPGPPFMTMNPSFPNTSGPSFPESPSVTNPPFPPFTTIGFNPPTNQPVDIGLPTDTNTETSFNMSSIDPELLPPITFPNGMIDASQSTPFSLFPFPIFLNSSYLEVTEK